MIDFTTQQSRSYSELIEREGPSEDEIDHQALQIMRGLTELDISDALHDSMPQLRDMALAEDMSGAGMVVINALRDYCRRVAQRVMEA